MVNGPENERPPPAKIAPVIGVQLEHGLYLVRQIFALPQAIRIIGGVRHQQLILEPIDVAVRAAEQIDGIGEPPSNHLGIGIRRQGWLALFHQFQCVLHVLDGPVNSGEGWYGLVAMLRFDSVGRAPMPSECLMGRVWHYIPMARIRLTGRTMGQRYLIRMWGRKRTRRHDGRGKRPDPQPSVAVFATSLRCWATWAFTPSS